VSSGARARAGARIPAEIVARGGNGSSATTPRSVGSAAKLLERGSVAGRGAARVRGREAGPGCQGAAGGAGGQRNRGQREEEEERTDGWGRAASEMERKGAAERRLGLGTAHAGEKGKGRRGCTGPREGKERGKGEGFGPAGWAPFPSFSFSTLHYFKPNYLNSNAN
jgi:hypothetical protein